MRCKINKTVVERINPSEKDVIVWDSQIRGFCVKVTPRGRRAFFIYYRTKNGRQRKPKIGDYGTLTVDQARQLAREILAEAIKGGDFSRDRQNGRIAETVNELCSLYLSDYAEARAKKSIHTDRSNIENHIRPLLGPLKVRDVTRSDILQAQRAVSEGKTAAHKKARPRGRRIVKGGKGVSNRTIALLSKMFAFSIDLGLRTDNPAARILKYPEYRKDRFLDDTEIGRLSMALSAAEKSGTETKYAIAAIRLLLLTGLRLGDVLGLRWRNVDLKNGCLRLDHGKTGARAVYIGQSALAVIAKLGIGEPDELIIRGALSGTSLALSRPWYRLRASAGIDRSANLHCLRHTFASWAVMGGLSLPQVGAMLGHRSAQTTLRYADHLRDAQKSYAERTSAIIAAFSA